MRSQRATLVVVVATVAAVVVLGLPAWLPVAVAVPVALTAVLVAEASYRHLGHTLTPHHLVSGRGATTRVCTVLETDGVIGWVVRETYFQRRVGLATLVAGPKKVVVRNLPLERAVPLADARTPGLLDDFTTRRG